MSKNPHLFWSQSKEEIISSLKTDSQKGLSHTEASLRLKSDGPNLLPRRQSRDKWTIFLNQLKNPLIFILIIATAITVALGEFGDSLLIFAAVVVNSVLGFYQENKAESALDKLDDYVKQTAVVLRDGYEQIVSTENLVVGDIISISTGSRIPADARLIFDRDLQIDEAILTGESLPVKKTSASVKENTILAERKNMAWTGSLVVEGSGLAAVTVTGADTELGRIASLVQSSVLEDTPLQKSIKDFAGKLGAIIIILTAILFATGLYFGHDIMDMFFTSVAVAVMSVPEGLPIALTVILSVGVERMARRKGIVRRLLAAETLGSASMILTDKTGTLTESRMGLSQAIPISKKFDIHSMLSLAVINTEAVIENSDGKPDTWRVFGHPLEVSLIKEVGKYKISPLAVKKDWQVIDRLGFNSKNKFSAVLGKNGRQTVISYLGAPDILLTKSTLTKSERHRLSAQIDELAFSGEKVVGVALRKISAKSTPDLNDSQTHQKLEFVGLISFRDPVRKNVRHSLLAAAKLGVGTVIVTGDHRGTAEAVAKEVGLDMKTGLVFTGAELDSLSDDDLRNRLPDIRVFARVTPEQKQRIAKIYKSRGEVIAMTGDGVNDAPALKEADIGIAVGSGTEVAKGASDLIILDDNFKTIVAAIEEGRKTLDNIKKVIVYLLSNVVDGLILIGGALILGIPIPLNALQILWVNFFSNSFPAVGLAFEDLPEKRGRSRNNLKKELFDARMKFLILGIGFGSSILIFSLYYLLFSLGLEQKLVSTFIFAVFGIYSLIVVFSMRSLRSSILKYNFWENYYVTAGVAVGILLMALAIYLPLFQSLLGTVPLSPLWVLAVFAVGLFNIIAVEFGKYLYRNL